VQDVFTANLTGGSEPAPVVSAVVPQVSQGRYVFTIEANQVPATPFLLNVTLPVGPSRGSRSIMGGAFTLVIR
jgi:hypothetical protein